MGCKELPVSFMAKGERTHPTLKKEFLLQGTIVGIGRAGKNFMAVASPHTFLSGPKNQDYTIKFLLG